MEKLFKKYKYPVIAFISGLVLMSVELTSTRILAPLVGSSVYTWTSVIGTILLGLTVGSWLGGKLIDKYKKESLLIGVLILAAIFIAIIPESTHFFDRITLLDIPLLGIITLFSLLLFFLPAAFLGAIYPIVLKLSTENIDDVGGYSGSLSALGSLGSICGTFLTGFFFIGFLGSATTLYVLTMLLLLTAFFLQASKKILIPATMIALIIIGVDHPKAFATFKVFEAESNYYKIQVSDAWNERFGNHRILFLDFDSHSIENTDGKKIGIYTEFTPAFRAFKSDISSIYMIGGGSYSMAKKFSQEYPLAKMTVAEIDPKVTETARNFFNLSAYDITTISKDGRVDLETSSQRYDIIFGDAYNSFISVPWHMTTMEFNELAKNRLREGGIYAVNFISSLHGENSLLFQSMVKTFQRTFPNFYIFTYGNTATEPQNIILVGLNSNNKIDPQSLPPIFADKYRASEDFSYTDGVFLRDNYAPVERLMLPLMNNYFGEYIRTYGKLTR